jgi:hypothetical protein
VTDHAEPVPEIDGTPRQIFVVGTGRSGTHWLGYILGSHPQVHLTVEDSRWFYDVTTMALDPSQEDRLFPGVVEQYRREHEEHPRRHFADKSHPNLWLVERLSTEFPDALFVGIQRNAFGTVASMLRHEGVQQWHRRWREFPVPNRFLGITEELAQSYDELPLAAQCALRWRAHADRMQELRVAMPDRLWCGDYDSFITSTADSVEDLRAFLGLAPPMAMPEVKTDSLDAWRSELSEDDVEAIAKFASVPVPA